MNLQIQFSLLLVLQTLTPPHPSPQEGTSLYSDGSLNSMGVNMTKHGFLCFLNFSPTLLSLHSSAFLLYFFLYSSSLFYLSFPCNNSAYTLLYFICLLLLFLCSFSSSLSYFPLSPGPSVSNSSPFEPHFHCLLFCPRTLFYSPPTVQKSCGITSFVA
jgi:hypothetical protein